MKSISLTQGKKAIVDDEDFEYLSGFKWCARLDSGNWYAVRHDKHNKEHKMHREIMGAKPGEIIDHKDGNSLNNRKENLRFCTNSENIRNSKIYSTNTTGYKGVSVNKNRTRFRATIGLGGKNKTIGYYDTAEEAAKAYDEYAIKYFGDFARTNF